MAFALAGISGVVGGVSNALTGVTSFVGDILGGSSKDPERYKRNQAWYEAAVAGDQDALLALKGMSGRFGLIPKGEPPGGSKYCACSGWATEGTRNDAYKKYQDAVSRLSGGSASGTGSGGGSTATSGAAGTDWLLWLALAAGAFFVLRRVL